MDFSSFTYAIYHSKKKIVIVKLDFEKAFDKMEHQTNLEVLKLKGFTNKWVNWAEGILNSRTSSMLLNEIPSKPFTYKRGG